jgi:hypothetical protein
VRERGRMEKEEDNLGLKYKRKERWMEAQKGEGG